MKLKLLSKLTNVVSKNKEPILMVAGSCFHAAGLAVAVINGPKLLDTMADVKSAKENGIDIDHRQVVGDLIFDGGPILLLFAAGEFCHWRARKITLASLSSMAATAAVLADNKDSFQEATRKVVGPETYKKIQDKAADESVSRHFQAREETDIPQIIETGYGNDLFMEKETKQVFKASKKWIEDQYRELYYDVFPHGSKSFVPAKDAVCHNTLLEYLGLRDDIPAYDQMGYLHNNLPEPRFSYPEEAPEYIRKKYGGDLIIVSPSIEPTYLGKDFDRYE